MTGQDLEEYQALMTWVKALDAATEATLAGRALGVAQHPNRLCFTLCDDGEVELALRD